MKNFTFLIAFLGLFSWQGTTQTCGNFTVILEDSWLGGWEGAFIDVYVNGKIFRDSVTNKFSHKADSLVIPVNKGDIISIEYTIGKNASENKYTVYNQVNTVVAIEGKGLAIPGDIGDWAIPSGLAACSNNNGCAIPNTLTSSGITSSSANLDWKETGSATIWDIEWGVAGFTLGSGTKDSALTAHPYSLSGLTKNTSYDFYVRADCGGGIHSAWSAKANFKTGTGPICKPVTAVSANNVTGISAELAWTENGIALAWDIEWGPTGFTLGSGTMVNMTPNNPYTLTGLSGNSFYDFYVRADCGSSNKSTWSSIVTFKTITGNGCIIPTSLSATNVTSVFAVLNWTENGSATKWDVEWGAKGFAQGSGTMVLGTTNNPHNLSGLTAGTAYDFYVRADCGTPGKSNWSSSLSFTTEGTSSIFYGHTQNIKFSLYPNPNNGLFELNIADINSQEIGIEIVNVTGRIVFEKRNASNNESIDLSNMATGIYYVTVNSDKGNATHKLVIQ